MKKLLLLLVLGTLLTSCAYVCKLPVPTEENGLVPHIGCLE